VSPCANDLAWGAKVTIPNSAWAGSGAWVSTECDNQSGPYPESGIYFIGTSFNIATCVDLSRVQIKGVYYTDNYAIDIKVNGVSIGSGGSFNSPTDITLTGAHLVHGNNTVIFEIFNEFEDSQGPNPMGLNVQWACQEIDNSESSESELAL
jgi:hypothetical protein